jgi:hypothetical protein
MVLDNQAWQQRYVIGQDKANAAIQNVPGEVWFFPSSGASVGQFDAADPQGILNSIESLLSRRARRAQIPLHLLTGGDIPSGEAMRSAEAGLVKKVEARMEVFGDAWEDVLRTGLQLADVPTDNLTIETQWRSPESRDDLEQADAAVKWKDAGVSQDSIMERYGWDVEKETERRNEQAEQQAGDLRSVLGGIAPEALAMMQRPGFPPGQAPGAEE